MSRQLEIDKSDNTFPSLAPIFEDKELRLAIVELNYIRFKVKEAIV